ncbi:hypothetical protein FG05_35256 [Fusarium graminearum]|nr:hypothetical protein FG05_35256 [Fusarium graminearum]
MQFKSTIFAIGLFVSACTATAIPEAAQHKGLSSLSFLMSKVYKPFCP